MIVLFPFDRAWGFGRDVVDDAVYAADFAGDAGRDGGEEIVGEACPVGGHAVG